MNTERIEALADVWRAEGARFEALGQRGAAAMSQAHARELEVALRAWREEALTLEEGSIEGGYSYSRLQRLVADGEIENAGEPGSPRIRRADLPRRPPRHRDDGADVSLAAEVLGSMAGG